MKKFQKLIDSMKNAKNKIKLKNHHQLKTSENQSRNKSKLLLFQNQKKTHLSIHKACQMTSFQINIETLTSNSTFKHPYQLKPNNLIQHQFKCNKIRLEHLHRRVKRKPCKGNLSIVLHSKVDMPRNLKMKNRF